MTDGAKVDVRDVLEQADKALDECILAIDVRCDANIAAEASYAAKQARRLIRDVLGVGAISTSAATVAPVCPRFVAPPGVWAMQSDAENRRLGCDVCGHPKAAHLPWNRGKAPLLHTPTPGAFRCPKCGGGSYGECFLCGPGSRLCATCDGEHLCEAER